MDLIKIYQGNVIDARELWGFLEVKTQFNKWITRMLDYGFEEDRDFWTNLSKNDNEKGRPQKDYFLSIGAAKEISMLQRSEKGKQARQYFIRCEETLVQLKKSERLQHWQDLEGSKQNFKHYLTSAGYTEENYIQVDYEGRKIFFNGEPLSDEVLPKILLIARNLAVEISNETLKNTGEKDLGKIASLHKTNHKDIRDYLKENIGKNPEELPPDEDIKKLE
jgi:phage anti-repressor protein